MQSTVAFDTKLPELKTFFVVSASRLLSFVVLSVSDLSFSFRGVNVFLSTVFWLPINTCLHFDVSEIQYGKMAKRKRKELILQEKVDVHVFAYKDKIQRSEFEKLQRSFNVVKHRFNPPYVTSRNCLINLLQMEMQPARGQGCADFKTSILQCQNGSEWIEVRTFLFWVPCYRQKPLLWLSKCNWKILKLQADGWRNLRPDTKSRA